MESVWESVVEGMNAGGWVVGFVLVLGIFLVVGGMIGLVLLYVFGEDEEEAEEKAEDPFADLDDDKVRWLP